MLTVCLNTWNTFQWFYYFGNGNMEGVDLVL